jgi:hypothetical protein
MSMNFSRKPERPSFNFRVLSLNKTGGNRENREKEQLCFLCFRPS